MTAQVFYKSTTTEERTCSWVTSDVIGSVGSVTEVDSEGDLRAFLHGDTDTDAGHVRDGRVLGRDDELHVSHRLNRQYLRVHRHAPHAVPRVRRHCIPKPVAYICVYMCGGT